MTNLNKGNKRKSKKHGKKNTFSTYGRNTVDLANFQTKKNRGYHGPRVKRGRKVPEEYKKWIEAKCAYYSYKLGQNVVQKTINKSKKKQKNY